jgi:hypothetical protein
VKVGEKGWLNAKAGAFELNSSARRKTRWAASPAQSGKKEGKGEEGAVA